MPYKHTVASSVHTSGSLQFVAPRRFLVWEQKLWTALGLDGIWHRKNNVDQNGGYATKLIFWTLGLDWKRNPNAQLVVTAVRTDGESPSVAVAGANIVFVGKKTPAMMTGIRIPTDGCWDIAAYYEGQRVTYTVLVVP
jgi:hypothetical protein